MTRWLICWVLVLSPVLSLLSQPTPDPLYFHHLNVSSGLSQAVNAFIHKDRQGFVWISSLDGLNRFDGQSVRVYRPQPGKPNSMLGNNIQSPFFEDEEGNLWFGTDGGINCYRRKTDDFSHFQVTRGGNLFVESYYIVHRDTLGRLWTRMNDSLYIITPPKPNSLWADARFIGRFPGQKHLCIQNDGDKFPRAIWAYMGGMVCTKYLVQGDVALEASKINVPQEVGYVSHASYDSSSNTLWLTSTNGVAMVDADNGKLLDLINVYQGQPMPACSYMAHLNEQTAYVSSDEGVFVLDKIQRRFVHNYNHQPTNTSSLASNDMLRELYIDRDSVLWVSIWTQGVDYSRINKVKFKTIDFSKLLLPDETAFSSDALCLDNNGDLWIGGNMDEFRVIRNKSTRSEAVYGPKGISLQISDIKKTRSGDLIMISGGGELYLNDLRKRKILLIQPPVESGKKVEIRDVLELQSGEILVSADSMMYRMVGRITDKPKWEVLEVVDIPLGEKTYFQLFQDSHGRIYITSMEKAMNVFNFKSNRLVWMASFPFNHSANAFVESDSNLWISSPSMLGVINTNLLKQGSKLNMDTFFNQAVYGVILDNNQRLWFSSNKGILRLSKGEKEPHFYHLSDGLQGFEFNSAAYQQTPDGRMWFGGVNGINYFHPDSVFDIQTRAPVLLTGINVNDEPLNLPYNICLADTLNLDYFQNKLSFEFVVADFSDPKHTQHWYRMRRLDGPSPDDDWVKGQSSRGFARYANLAPGKYLFEIKGANADGIVNPDIRTICINIKPHFTQTTTFLLLCVLASLLVTYVVVRAIVRNKFRLKNLQLREQSLQIEKQEALTKERNRIAGEMHDDLGGGLTSIRMLSERLTAKTDNPDMKNAVDKIAGHAQSLVLRMSEIIWAMNSNFDTVDNLIAYIRRYCAEYLDEHNLRSRIKTPENATDITISGEKRRNVYLAVKESLHNIVKHAQADRVNIDFELDNNQLVITVRDNGRGIDPELINQFGNGLYNMKKRLEDVGGTMTLVNDEGTNITFSIPFNSPTP